LKLRNSNSQENISAEPNTLLLSSIAAWQLAKVPLCLLIACSACFGALVTDNPSAHQVMYAAFGVLLLASGAATFNSIQEVSVDGSMRRTAKRPLVRKIVSPNSAKFQASILVALGLFLLSRLTSPVFPVLLGSVALLLYNGVYTRLKQHTVLAILPGAVCGALPPLIGWTAAGGKPVSYMSLLLFSLLFLWQIPHFYLILLRYREDYLQAHQPSFLKILSETAVRRLSCIWICGLSLVMMLFSTTPAAVSVLQQLLVLANAFVLAIIAICNLLLRQSDTYRLLFISLNLILFNHMVILSARTFLF
jgi:protoheme IX farnesyltransferase